MDNGNSLSIERKEIVSKLNGNLEEIGQINLELKLLKQQNRSLEARLNNENINNDNSEKEIKNLNEKLEELRKINEELKRESNEIDQQTINLQKELNEKKK